MCFISIIIPIFNTEQYLPRCIESVLSQRYSDFELILVDDGSTDASGAICDSYSERDHRIRVFHKENGGVSSARNLGLEKARGEWIYFVDSDDELLPDGLRVLTDCISDEVDIVMGGFVEVDENGVLSEPANNTSRILTKKQSVVTLYVGYGSYCYLWTRLLKREVIRRFNLCFDPSIAIKEDTLFLMQYICKSNGKTRQSTIPVYQYRRRSDSAMGKALNGEVSKYIDSFHALVKMKKEVETLYPSYSAPMFIAKQAIFGRYYSIIRMMDTANVRDEELTNKLYLAMRKEVGSLFLFKVERKVRKLLGIVGKSD